MTVFLYIYYFTRIFSAREFLGDLTFSEAQEVLKIEYYGSYSSFVSLSIRFAAIRNCNPLPETTVPETALRRTPDATPYLARLVSRTRPHPNGNGTIRSFVGVVAVRRSSCPSSFPLFLCQLFNSLPLGLLLDFRGGKPAVFIYPLPLCLLPNSCLLPQPPILCLLSPCLPFLHILPSSTPLLPILPPLSLLHSSLLPSPYMSYLRFVAFSMCLYI